MSKGIQWTVLKKVWMLTYCTSHTAMPTFRLIHVIIIDAQMWF
jgi:hypothetical protein